MSSAILKRIEKLEEALAASRNPQLCFVHTKSLANRIGKALPDSTDITLVHMKFRSEAADAEYELRLREDSPSEAARLDRLLAGEVW